MKKRSLPLARAYRLLEPGPVVLLGTSRGGRANVMPMSKGCPDPFHVGVTGAVCAQITGASAKADWPSVEPARRRDAGRQRRPQPCEIG